MHATLLASSRGIHGQGLLEFRSGAWSGGFWAVGLADLPDTCGFSGRARLQGRVLDVQNLPVRVHYSTDRFAFFVPLDVAALEARFDAEAPAPAATPAKLAARQARAPRAARHAL